jgi:hypothetical protein
MEASIYNIHSAPLRTGMPEHTTDVTELKRFCLEQRLPLFCTTVDEIEYFPNITEKVKKPYVKYFTIYNGIQITATDKLESRCSSFTPQEAQP